MKKEKIYNLLLFILIFCTILSIIILNHISDFDELWNYNFARNVADGLIPYKDFNMLQMPLLPLICGLVLKITFNELIVMRILATLLCSVIIYITYRLFNILNMKKEIATIFTFFIGYLFKDIFCIDYNWATLLLVLLIIYNEIKQYKKDNLLFKTNIRNDLILGTLAGLTITLKQTSGILICIALLGNKLLFVSNKKELKLYLKSFIYRLIGVILPALIMLIYLICNNAFYDFIDYTIKGISGFNNYISYRNLVKCNVIGILAILVPLSFIYFWYKSIVKEKDKNIYFILVYGLAMFIIAFPISNKIHFLIGATPTIILILYELYNIIQILYNKFLKNKKILIKIFWGSIYVVNVCIILILIKFVGFNINNYLKIKDNYSNLEHYKYIPINITLENQIKEVDNYLLNSNKEVKILDASAAIYMIPIDKYNKNYDMLLKGNIGENGEEKLIEDINESQNKQYLLLKEAYKKNWQTPLEVISYVKENKTKIGEIGIFDIYE